MRLIRRLCVLALIGRWRRNLSTALRRLLGVRGRCSRGQRREARALPQLLARRLQLRCRLILRREFGLWCNGSRAGGLLRL